MLLWVISSGEGGTTNASKLGKRDGKRDALARTPPSAPARPERPPPAESRKKTRGTGALQAALAAAAPPAAAPQPLTASSALWFDSIDGSMRQFDAGVPRPCRRHTTSRKAKPG